jgi:hypothetical protein
MGRYDILLQQDQPKPTEPAVTSVGVVHEQTISPSSRPDQAIPERANARTPVRSNGKRIITRNSFEIFEDQMDDLRELAFEEKRQGRLGSMSAMVRDAVDTYLARSKKA